MCLRMLPKTVIPFLPEAFGERCTVPPLIYVLFLARRIKQPTVLNLYIFPHSHTVTSFSLLVNIVESRNFIGGSACRKEETCSHRARVLRASHSFTHSFGWIVIYILLLHKRFTVWRCLKLNFPDFNKPKLDLIKFDSTCFIKVNMHSSEFGMLSFAGLLSKTPVLTKLALQVFIRIKAAAGQQFSEAIHPSAEKTQSSQMRMTNWTNTKHRLLTSMFQRPRMSSMLAPSTVVVQQVLVTMARRDRLKLKVGGNLWQGIGRARRLSSTPLLSGK